MKALWEFAQTPTGSLVLLALGIAWLTAVVLWPRGGSPRSSSPNTSPDAARVDWFQPTQWPVLTLQDATYDPSKLGSNDTFRHKVRFVITATGGVDLEVWTPLWESQEVRTQEPLTALLQREGPQGWQADDWGSEVPAVKLMAGQTFRGWIGLSPPRGEGLAVRLSRGNTGSLVFPLKVEGKLRYEKVRI